MTRAITFMPKVRAIGRRTTSPGLLLAALLVGACAGGGSGADATRGTGVGSTSASDTGTTTGTSGGDTAATSGTATSGTTLDTTTASTGGETWTSGGLGSTSGEGDSSTTGDEGLAVVETQPEDGATGWDPSSGELRFVFNRSMDSGMAPQIELTVGSDMAGGVLSHEWATTVVADDTLVVTIEWLQLPENTVLTWTLSAVQGLDASTLTEAVVGEFTTGVRPVAFPIADSGQTSCYYRSGGWNEDDLCDTQTYSVGDADAPAGQDGHYVDSPVARNLSIAQTNEGFDSDGVTADGLTGLSWTSCFVGQTGVDCGAGTAESVTWFAGFSACAGLNSENAEAGFGGRTDWRLPTARELGTLMDYSALPTLAPTSFPGVPGGSDVFALTATASADPSMETMAYVYDVSRGDSHLLSKAQSAHVLCVAEDSAPDEWGFHDNGDGTLSDAATGLRWQKCAKGQSGTTCGGSGDKEKNWSDALNYCESLELGDEGWGERTAWRVPNVAEMRSIFDYGHTGPSLDPAFEGAPQSASYFTSTTLVDKAHRFFPGLSQWGEIEQFLVKDFFVALPHVRCVADE